VSKLSSSVTTCADHKQSLGAIVSAKQTKYMFLVSDGKLQALTVARHPDSSTGNCLLSDFNKSVCCVFC